MKTVVTMAALVAASGTALAGFTTINSAPAAEVGLAGSGGVLDLVTGGSVTSVSDSRRVNDSFDRFFVDGTVPVSFTALFWGGTAAPEGSAAHEFFINNVTAMTSTSVFNTNDPGVDPGAQFGSFMAAPGELLTFEADNLTNGTVASSDPSGNTPFGDGTTDRMVTFDLTGLSLFEIDGMTPVTLSGEVPVYLLAFDTGSDQDFNDLVVLVEGARAIPLPHPAALATAGLAGLAVVRRRRSA